MDVRERWPHGEAALEEFVLSILDRRQSEMHTAMPVRVIKDSDGHTVALQPLIKRVMRKPDGSTELIDFPTISDVPVQFASGGGVTTTHPVKEKDEGIAIISSRSFDNWLQSGGEQNQGDARMHDMSDAFYIPGVRSNPRKLNNVSTTSTQMRSDDGKHFTDLHPEKGITHSVDGGKHVVSILKDGGIKLAAEGGKSVIDMAKGGGISIDSAMSLAVKAARGIDMKGALNVDGKVSSTKPIGGGVFAGVLQGGIGALLAILAMSALQIATSGHPEGVQQASYRLAALWSRP
jgi:hypothetical protein